MDGVRLVQCLVISRWVGVKRNRHRQRFATKDRKRHNGFTLGQSHARTRNHMDNMKLRDIFGGLGTLLVVAGLAAPHTAPPDLSLIYVPPASDSKSSFSMLMTIGELENIPEVYECECGLSFDFSNATNL